MHERIIGLYERTAADWDAARAGTRLETEWFDRFLAEVRPSGTILDIGCGSGRPAAYLAKQDYRVTGVDASHSLIALCQSRMPDEKWIVADMREFALDRRFDGLLAWHSFFHLHADDQRAMFPRFAARAAPGAALMFTSGPIAGQAIGEWGGEPLFHDSLAPDDYRALLAANGFEVLSFTAGEPVAGGPTVWLARFPS